MLVLRKPSRRRRQNYVLQAGGGKTSRHTKLTKLCVLCKAFAAKLRAKLLAGGGKRSFASHTKLTFVSRRQQAFVWRFSKCWTSWTSWTYISCFYHVLDVCPRCPAFSSRSSSARSGCKTMFCIQRQLSNTL